MHSHKHTHTSLSQTKVEPDKNQHSHKTKMNPTLYTFASINDPGCVWVEIKTWHFASPLHPNCMANHTHLISSLSSSTIPDDSWGSPYSTKSHQLFFPCYTFETWQKKTNNIRKKTLDSGYTFFNQSQNNNVHYVQAKDQSHVSALNFTVRKKGGKKRNKKSLDNSSEKLQIYIFTGIGSMLITSITRSHVDITIGNTALIATRRRTIVRGGKYFIRNADVSIKDM